jgi:hypothetical protein
MFLYSPSHQHYKPIFFVGDFTTMMTVNKLTKTFSSGLATGAAAIGVLAVSVLTATSASAVTITWLAWTSGTPLVAGDKTASFQSIGGGFVADPGDEVSLNFIGDEFFFEYNALPGPSVGNFSTGSFTYTIAIAPNSTQHFSGVSLDSDVTSTYGNVIKTIAETGTTLTSVNGSPDPAFGFAPLPSLRLLTVTDTLNPINPGEAVITLSNGFIQRNSIPPVPEPGTILGILAVGGAGLLSKLKKQK